MNFADAPLYCCKHCKGLFNIQDDSIKHQQACIGNPFKSSCPFFACERKIFLQLFQSEDFQSDDGFFSTQNMSKDDSFLNHIVKVRLPQDIIDPSIFLRTPIPSSSQQMAEESSFLLGTDLTEREDSNFLLDSTLTQPGADISRNTPDCASFLLGPNISAPDSQMESSSNFLLTSTITVDPLDRDMKKSSEFIDSEKSSFSDSLEHERIRKIINKNIDYLKSSEITSMTKSGTFPTSHSESRLLSPIDKHFLPYGSKSRVQSPFDKSLSFLDGGLSSNPCMYASNSSIPYSCNLSTDLLSSLASTQDDNQASLLTNIEECPTLQYLDLAKKDPFFGQNLGLPPINVKDPFLITAGEKVEKPPPQPNKDPPPSSQLTKSSEDFQASPTFSLQDSNYFNFPSILDEPTQLDYLDLATLDFLTNPSFSTCGGELKDDTMSSVDPWDNQADLVEDPDCTNEKSSKRGKTSKIKSLAFKKVKSQIQKKKKTQAQREKETFSALSQGLNLEVKVMPRTSKIKVNTSSRKRKITPTQDSMDRNECPEEKTKSKFDRKFNEKQRICQTGQILNIKDQLTGFTEEEKDSMKAVFGQNGCIIVKKQKLASHRSSCFENVGVAFVNERPVLRRANSLDERSDRPKEVPDEEPPQTTFRYLEGDAPGPFGISIKQPRPQGSLTSVLKLKCQECSFKCSTVTELKEHYDQHDRDKKELEAECESILGRPDILSGADSSACVFRLDLTSDKCQETPLQNPIMISTEDLIVVKNGVEVLSKFESNLNPSHEVENNKDDDEFNIEEFMGSIGKSYDSGMADGISTDYSLGSNQSIQNACVSDSDAVTIMNSSVIADLDNSISSLPEISNTSKTSEPSCNVTTLSFAVCSGHSSCEQGRKFDQLDPLHIVDSVNNALTAGSDMLDDPLCQLSEDSKRENRPDNLPQNKFGRPTETSAVIKSLVKMRRHSESAFVKYTKVSSESVIFSDKSALQPLETVQVLQPEPYIVVEKELCLTKGHSTKCETNAEALINDADKPKSLDHNLSPNGDNMLQTSEESKKGNGSILPEDSGLDKHEKCKKSLKQYLSRKSKESKSGKVAAAGSSRVTRASKNTQTPLGTIETASKQKETDVINGKEHGKVQPRRACRAVARLKPARRSKSMGKQFSPDETSDVEEKVSKGQRPEFLTCGVCNYKTKQHNYMTEHMRKHDGTYLYCTAPDCDFKTVYLRNLTFHQRKHNTQQLLCDQCANTFSDQNSLRRHIQQHHLQERRFKCPDCDFATLFRGDVLKHYRNMHRQQKLYACNQCEYRTGYTHLLKFHLMAHAGIRPYKCSGCDYKVNNFNKVTRHIRTRHAGEVGINCEKLDLTFEVDAKQFQCEDKISDEDIHVIEMTEEQMKEYAIKRQEMNANESNKGQEKNKKANSQTNKKAQNKTSTPLSEKPRMVSLLGDLNKIAQKMKDSVDGSNTCTTTDESRKFVENYLNNNSECSVLMNPMVDILTPLDNEKQEVIEIVKIPIESDNIESYDTVYQCVLCAYMFSSANEVAEHITCCTKQKLLSGRAGVSN